LADPAGAATFYVRANGDDAANGSSPATAFQTMTRAAAAVRNPGDRVIVGPGTYGEGDVTPAWSGIEGHLVEFVADPTGVVTGDAPGPVVLQPSAPQTTGFLILGRHHVLIDGFTVIGAVDAGIQVRSDAFGNPSNDVVIRNAEVRDSVKRGIDVTTAGRVTITDNVATGNGSGGISVAAAPGERIVPMVSNNRVARNGAHGIFVSGALGGSITQNTAEDNVEAGILLRASSGVSIERNSVTATLDGIAAGVGSEAGAAVNHVRIADNTVRTARTGINVTGNGSITLERNDVGNSATSGLFISGDGAVRVTLEANTVAASGMDGTSIRGAGSVGITEHVVQASGKAGIRIRESGNVLIARSTVTGNGDGGVDIVSSGSLTLRESMVTDNLNVGVSIVAQGSLRPTIANNTLGRNTGHGLFLLGPTAGVVQNNVIFSNTDTGVTLRSAPNMLLANNLVYANSFDGLAVGTNDLAAPNATILHNTVYANGRWGLLLGTSLAPSPGARVIANIFQGNRGEPPQGGGVAVARSSTCGYVSGFNVNADGFGEGTPRSAYDQVTDPLLLNPAGLDGRLGGSAYADDNFRLRQTRAGQPTDSPAIDGGAAPLAEIGLSGSTAVGGLADRGLADAGYHYGASADQVLTVPTPYMPIYVRRSGNDGNDGLAPERALASIQVAAERADAGGTVVVGPGRYVAGDDAERGGIHPDQNRGPVEFVADPSGVATGDLPGVVLVDAAGQDTGFVLLNVCRARVQGFHVTGALSAGIQVRAGSDDALVRDNVVFSNQRRGIEVLGADAAVVTNNLVYVNGTGGIHLEQGNNSDVIGNTVYGNGDVGILIGGSSADLAALGVAVERNLVAANGQGVRVQSNSLSAYYTGFNVVPDGFEGITPRADSDFEPDVAVRLLVDPSGRDGLAGGEGFLDDDFHLVGDDARSNPAIDVDFGEQNTLATGSTRVDGLPDVGPLDAGYHYSLFGVRAPVPAEPSVVFVRAGGDDDNDGSSPSQALASIGKAVDLASANAAIIIGPGTYAAPRLRIGGNGRRRGTPALIADDAGRLTGDVTGRVVVDARGAEGITVTGPALLEGLTIRGARGPGLRVLHGARDVTVRNVTLCGNTGDGIVTAGESVSVINNLIFGNGGAGVSVRLRRAAAATQVLGNTVSSNLKRGVVIRESGAQVSRVLAYNNIISGNVRAGLTAPALRGRAPLMGNNLNADGYGPRTRAAAGDVTLAPQFVAAPPVHVIGCQGGDGFRLSRTSPAIDAGVGTAIELGLRQRSVLADGTPDTGPVDLGYHYRQ
jgi:parallel beta-helix repeat protein